MKGTYLLTILFTITLVVVAVNESWLYDDAKCPEIDPINATIHLPHKDCDKFYKCLGGEKFEKQCPYMDKENKKRLHFNPKLQICDWPGNVGCKNKDDITSTSTSTSSTESTHTEPDTSKTTPTLNSCPTNTNGKAIRIPHESLCDSFYLCIDGDKEELKCPDGQLFDPKIHKCDYEENVDCRHISTKADTITTKTIPSQDFCPSNTNGKIIRIPHKSLCDHFYLCLDGNKEEVKCPDGKFFDTKNENCESAENVNCDTKIIWRKNWKTCPPKGSGIKALLPHECICNIYYKCVNGEKIWKRCPSGYYYDYVKEICDWSNKVNCIRPIPEPEPEPDTTTPISKPTVPPNRRCSAEEENIKFPHETNCNAYYLCSNGVKILQYCLAGLFFNDTLQLCEYPTDKNCKLTTPCSSASSLSPHECSCKKYYECVNGKQILRYCPGQLYYDYIRKVCDILDRVQCSTSTSKPTLTTEAITSKTTPTDNPATVKCPKQGKIKLPYPDDCKFYYLCVNGEKTLRKCSKGLLFHPLLRTCDWAENVDCKTASTIQQSTVEIEISSKCPSVGIARISHENDCTLFYNCDNGKKTLKKCSRGLNFNPLLRVCDFPENYPCSRIEISEGSSKDKSTTDEMANEVAGCIGNCPNEDPMDYTVLLPHDDCTKFCKCSHGLTYFYECPSDLRFDSIKNVCVYAKSAICGVRSINQISGINKEDSKDKENDNSKKSIDQEDRQRTSDKFWSGLPLISQFF